METAILLIHFANWDICVISDLEYMNHNTFIEHHLKLLVTLLEKV